MGVKRQVSQDGLGCRSNGPGPRGSQGEVRQGSLCWALHSLTFAPGFRPLGQPLGNTESLGWGSGGRGCTPTRRGPQRWLSQHYATKSSSLSYPRGTDSYPGVFFRVDTDGRGVRW